MFGMSEELRNFEYKGFTYDYQNVGDDDCDKICHEVVCGPIRIHFDYSSYSFPSVELLKLFIDCGCPERISSGPLTQADLEHIRGAGLITWNFELKSRDSDWYRTGVRATFGSERLVREYIAQTWPSCDILSLQPCFLVGMALELSQIEESIPRKVR